MGTPVGATTTDGGGSYVIFIPASEGGYNRLSHTVAVSDGDITSDFTLTRYTDNWDNFYSLTAPSYDSGTATYAITSAAELAWLSHWVNGGNSLAGVTVKLDNNIDLSGHAWVPIGNHYLNKFSGTFDGCGYAISGLEINGGGSFVGLFGDADNAVFRNINLVSVDITTNGAKAGGLAGCTYEGSITGCGVSGSIIQNGSNSDTGGLVGELDDTDVARSYSACSINANDNFNNNVGGLAGFASQNYSLKNCYASGRVTGGAYAGGLVGYGETGVVSYSYSGVEVSGAAYNGGLIGKNDGSTVSVGSVYWNVTKNPALTSTGAGAGVATAKTSGDMKKTEFVAALNGPNDYWKQVSNLNEGMPILSGVGDGAIAVWTVTYMNGGDFYASVPVGQGRPFSPPADPAGGAGVVFKGWCTDPSCSGADKWDFHTGIIAADRTLYAWWAPDANTVGGTVTNSGLPMSGLTVTLYSSYGSPGQTAAGTGTTDADGAYTIDSTVVSGEYTAVVEGLSGYYDLTAAPVTVTPLDLTADIDLIKAPGAPDYFITNSGTGFLVNGGSTADGTFGSALAACGGDGSRIIHFGMPGGALELDESAGYPGNVLISAVYKGGVVIKDTTAYTSYGLTIGDGVEAAFKDFSIAGDAAHMTCDPGSRFYMVYMEGGSLTIEEGTVINADSPYASALTLYSNAGLTMKGGMISATDANAACITNIGSGAVLIEDGTITSGNLCIYSCISNYGPGTLTVSGGIVTANNPFAYVIYSVGSGKISITGDARLVSINSYGIRNMGTAEINISGGEISGGAYAIFNDGDAPVKISGGSVSAAGGTAIAVYGSGGTTEISGGTVSGDIGILSYGTLAVSEDDGETLIEGASWGIENRGFFTDAGNPSVVINAGTVKGSFHGMENEFDGLVRINGGNITAVDSAFSAVFNSGSGTVEINGGDIAAADSALYAVFNSGSGTVEINGGHITASISASATVLNSGPGAINATGGVISGGEPAIRNSSAGSVKISGSAEIRSEGESAVRLEKSTLDAAYMDVFGKVIHGHDLAAVTLKGKLTEGEYAVDSSNYTQALLDADDYAVGYTFAAWTSDEAREARVGSSAPATVASLTAGGNGSIYVSVAPDPFYFGVPTGGSFTDTDDYVDRIGGTLSWTVPDDTSGITGYRVYWSADGSTKLSADAAFTAAGASTASRAVPVGTDLPAGANYFLVYSSGEAGDGLSCLAIPITDRVVNAEEPDIDTQPLSASGNIGGAVVFSVEASAPDGGALSYRWQKSADGGASWSDIAGAISDSYTTGILAYADNGTKYRCVVTNSKNETTATATSDAATLTVNPAAETPAIDEQPSDVAKNIGQTAAFTVSATAPDGGSLTFKWQKSTDGGANWSDIAGAISDSYTTGILAYADNGTKYRCVVTNSKNETTATATSDAAKLTVNPAAAVPEIDEQPSGVAKNTGQTAAFTVSAAAPDGGSLTFKWQKSTDGGASWNDIAGASSDSYTTGVLAYTDNGAQYRCVVTNSKNETTATVTSDAATLTVSPANTQAAPSFTPTGGAIALGSTVTISSEGADHIYYTTDDSDPATAAGGSTLEYTGPVAVNEAMTIKAVAVKAGRLPSAIASASFTQAESADLISLVLSGAPEGFAFMGGTYAYSGVTVANEVESVTVTPTGAGVIMVDGVEVESGSASESIALTAGVERTIAVVATQTGRASKTYLLGITRDAPNAPVAPAAPVILSAVAGDAHVNIVWSSVSAAASYKVYQSTTPGSLGMELAAVDAPVCSYDAAGLANGTTYYFVVRAANAGGDSADSNEVSATPQAPAPRAPEIRSAVAGDGCVTVTWSPVPGSAGYKVYYSTTPAVYTTPAAIVLEEADNCTVSGLVNGVAYYFVVTASNPGGDSPYSNEVGATPRASAPCEPAEVTAAGGNARVTLNWSAVAGAAEYKIYRTTTPGSYGAELASVAGHVHSYESTGLTNGVTYYFVIKAANAGGEGPVSAEVCATPGTVPGMPSNVTASAGDRRATVSFTAPADNGGSPITGYIVTSNPGNLTAAGAVTAITVTGLTNGTAYTFTVRAVNTTGTGPSSEASNRVTPRRPSRPDDDTEPENSGGEAGVEILINGKTEYAATATTVTADGKRITTVMVDDGKVEEKLRNEGDRSVVTIPFANAPDVAAGRLNGQTVKNMETKEAVLEIKTGNVTYTLEASQINIDDVSSQLGNPAGLEDITVDIRISAPPDETVKVIEDSANAGKLILVAKPVEFEITCTYGERSVQVTNFSSYVERMIAIPEGIEPSKITTAVVLNPDGTFSHVPTAIVVIDGKYYAKINSLTNSIYSLIYNPRAFKDAEGHWAREAVNDMGSRLIISGVGEDRFEPDRDITRAEFAAAIVRALGLMRPGGGKDAFIDVNKADWYYDVVSIACEHGLIDGYGDGRFGPADKITREQSMAIVARAMKITGLKAELTEEETVRLLKAFVDSPKASDYAGKSIAACLRAGVVFGRSAGLLAPEDNITRAEAAVMIRRLLQKSDLI